MSETDLAKILKTYPKALIEELPAPNFKIQIANGSVVPIRKQVLLQFDIAGTSSTETYARNMRRSNKAQQARETNI